MLEPLVGRSWVDRMRLPLEPEGRVAAIAERLAALLGDEALRGIGPHLRAVAVEHFDWGVKARQMVDAYRETGAFPDGAVIVKELFGTATEDMTTGRVSHAHEVEGWFVMIKDAKGRFPDHGLWGNGWGWALFNADDPSTPVTEDYEAECIACHVPAEGTDWIYVEGYPGLQE